MACLSFAVHLFTCLCDHEFCLLCRTQDGVTKGQSVCVSVWGDSSDFSLQVPNTLRKQEVLSHLFLFPIHCLNPKII